MSFPAFLKGKIASAIEGVFNKLWSVIEEQEGVLYSLSRAHSTSKTGVELFLKELPVSGVSQIKSDYKRNYIINFSKYVESAGTNEAIELTKEIFELDEFEYEIMYDSYQEHYPIHQIRFFLDKSDSGKVEQIKKYLEKILPARCSKHMQLVDLKTEPKGLGKTSLGKRLGK